MLYAVLFDDKWMKVGWSETDPEERIKRHIYDKSNIAGALPVGSCIWEGDAFAEHLLICALTEAGYQQRGGEWFEGVTLADVELAIAKTKTTRYTRLLSMPLRLRSGSMVCINELVSELNKTRISKGLSPMTVQQVKCSSDVKAAVSAAMELWELSSEQVLHSSGKGPQARSYCHIAVAVAIANMMSPTFHAKLIKTFVEAGLAKFNQNGGTEFPALNSALMLHLPEQDYSGLFLEIAEILRSKILGQGAQPGDWAAASVWQHNMKDEYESDLVKFLSAGLVRDAEHAKALARKV